MNQPHSSHHILTIEEPSFRKTVILEEATYSLGRHSNNDIILAVQKVSRHHATLLRRTDVKTNKYSYWILDGDLQGNRSRNGIYINGRQCLVHELKHGDVIKFSREIQAKYQILSDVAQTKIKDESFVSTVEVEVEVASPISDRETLLNKETLINSQEELPASNSAELLRLSSFAELSPQAIIEVDLEGNLTYANSTAGSLFKHEENSHPLIADLPARCNQKNISYTREVQIKNNYYQQYSYYLVEQKLIRSYLTDITRQKRIENKLEEQAKQYKIIFENNFYGIIIISAHSRKIREINNIACKSLGTTELEMVNNYIEDFVLNQEKLVDILQQMLADQRDYSGTLILKTQDGNLINTELEIRLIHSEIEPKFCFTIKKENNIAFTLPKDKVSSLPRLKVLKKQLGTAIANADRNQKLLAVLAVEINNFANVRGAISKEQKIILLSSFSERLKACLRFGDTVAYNDEDKFSILMQEISTIQEIAKISQRIVDSLQQPFKVGEQQLSITGNIGIAVYPQDGDDPDTLLSNANLALEKISESENCFYQFYNSTMNSQNSVTLKLESFLHDALEKDEFILYYQPQINVKSGTIQGVEALLRWQHPELGLVSPTSFINLAEQTGLIVPIGQWVLKTACQQNKIWHSQGFPPLRVSVNLSPLQFKQPDFPLVVSRILEETQLKPNLLELEVSASTVMKDLEYSYHMLSQLQSLGVYISIDDFTTSYASWERLKHIPFDTLKINRDFVRQLKNDPQDLAIISAMVSLGRGFNLRVVAEGVETLQQIELLRSQNCEQMQGFWFSRPLAAEEATKLLPFDYNVL
ncbi:Diguanylate cyclase/phosphodiesterase with PAS/PAC sensor(S) [Hyella patelloides LEGE 07179]|uniref:Diguanylate cyclase/phosphodiesterase with PAS/PAC sensor(S) n=1 Tax=Hyella patelloides LEGE 07179 TaxID=945734 RepID=A0A563VU60_9CYAN|nr:EAL domain-containing protein [Hyella patelloides]VEP14919.1 Diguanylate cyclase/phosphodiesterase with PAS/PAC sensor(S) [Hyella patelloides LEGE 07179]